MTLITPHLILENLEVPFIHIYECLVQCKNIEKKNEITILIYQETKDIFNGIYLRLHSVNLELLRYTTFSSIASRAQVNRE